MFLHGQKISKDLRRVKFVGQPVIDRHARILRQLLHNVLAKAAIFDRVVDPAQNPRGIFDRFLVADMRTRGPKIRHPRALIIGRDLKANAGPRAVFFKDQRDVLALQLWYFGARVFCHLQIGGKL